MNVLAWLCILLHLNCKEMIQPKVTVIVPIYNVAAYIEKCAKSLFDQTLGDLEILFVDDCGQDNSLFIIEQLLQKYPQRATQTKIIHREKNGGSAAARKSGLEVATGQYIIQCDGDDWVDIDLYEKMYNKAIETEADIVVCDEIHEYANKSNLWSMGDLPINSKDVVKDWYKRTIGMHVHNKLIKRSIYIDNDIMPWDGLNMWEDNGLITRLFYYSTKLTQIHDSYYHYNRTNVNAMTSGYGIKQVEQMICVAKGLTEFFQTKPDAKEFEKTIKAFQFLARINLITDSFANFLRYKNTFRGSETIIPELDPKAFSAKGLFRFRMVQYHLGWLFVLMFKVKNLIKDK